jgi:hypothetical protein
MQYIVLVAAFIFLSPSLSHAQPDALFTEVNYDFGRVSHVNRIKHVFEVSNIGDEDLTIERLVTCNALMFFIGRASLTPLGSCQWHLRGPVSGQES